MKVEKKVIGTLTKCYSVAPLHYNGKDHILVAAEKQDPCQLFDLDGNYEETVWEGPGGTMSMVQVPGSNGEFLATHKFYSPNDSKEAKIVRVCPENGEWKVSVLRELPFVHRFDIISRNGVRYLIACALKSDHEYKDDWTHPGKVYAGVLPDDLSSYSEDNQLELSVIKEGMTKNHGYYKVIRGGLETAIISCDEGVYAFTPPEAPDKEWTIEQLISDPASDGVLLDLDGDGREELAVISPFHGQYIYIYRNEDGGFKRVYEYGEPAEFAHSIYGGSLCGRPAVVIGHRKGQDGISSPSSGTRRRRTSTRRFSTRTAAPPMSTTMRRMGRISLFPPTGKSMRSPCTPSSEEVLWEAGWKNLNGAAII